MKLVSILSCHNVVTSLEEVEMVKYTNVLLTSQVKKKSSALPAKLKRRYYSMLVECINNCAYIYALSETLESESSFVYKNLQFTG